MRSVKGFTLLEILVTVAIISIVAAILFANYNTFASRSVLHSRIAEITNIIFFAQDRSAAGLREIDNSENKIGFQIVRVKVRDGELTDITSEEVRGNTHLTRNSCTPGGTGDCVKEFASTNASVSFSSLFVEVCAISRTGAVSTTRFQGLPMTFPDPDDFDIYLSIEYPTREVYFNVLPEDSSNYSMHTFPDAQRISSTYDGVRIELRLADDSVKRSIDIYNTGLIETEGYKYAEGCV